jgi:nucleoside-diphosphate-sugar epimerase
MNLSLDFPPSGFSSEGLEGIKPGTRILVTGASGFVGSRLVELLVDKFRCEVFAMVRDFSKAMKISHLPVRFISGDLRKTDWQNQLPAQLDYVFHCAYGSSGSGKERSETELAGLRNLVEFTAGKGLKKFVFLSTVSVFRTIKSGVVNENSALNPADGYAANKLKAEALLSAECSRRNIPFTIFRPSAILGPGAPTYVNRIFREVRSNEIFMLDEGRGRLNWIYVDDVVRAMLSCLFLPESASRNYILSHPEPVTHIAFYRAMAEVAGEPLTVKFVSRTENLAYLKKQKPRISAIMLSAIDRKKLRPLMQFPFLAFLLKFVMKFLPRPGITKPVPAVLVIQPAKTALPVPEEYADFFSSEMVFRSEFLLRDKVLTQYTPFEAALDRIRLRTEWEKAWQD